MADEVLYEKKDHIATIALNRPPINAYTTAMMRELERIWNDCQADANVRVVLLTSTPGLPFGVGADMKMMF
ncbi:MAG: enoyl-CoA hydratase/isomerase family protein, partial [Chloroflexi bacterium]|nr:enoyl-CoA hydratase/isomerase family protein [Chloroflexota bacterium]